MNIHIKRPGGSTYPAELASVEGLRLKILSIQAHDLVSLFPYRDGMLALS